MRQFQKLLHELKGLVESHRPGDEIKPPESLPRIELDGRRLTYATAGVDLGDGAAPVVLLHGFGGFFMDWPRVMAPIARHTKVYALDLPGWGFSEPNRDARSLEDEVAIVEAFMAKLELRDVILCGISYGAGVAWATAATGSRRVKRAVLLNPMPTFPMRFLHSAIYNGIFIANSNETIGIWGHRLMSKAQYKIICRENLLNDRLLDTFYLDLAYLVMKQPKMPFILGKHARGARTVDWAGWEHRLAGTRTPVSILQAKQDRIFSMESALHLHRLIPTSELIEVADCGHAMVFDQHKRVSEFILRHVRPREQHESLQENVREKRRG
jgi:pimeloyl-ACP methyl ester carboxylesterase